MAKYVRICIDRILPKDLDRYRRTIAVGPGGRMRAIAVANSLWMNGTTLHVRFMGGTASMQAQAKTQARWWTAHANLKFVFDNARDADIRIACDRNDGAWSYIGTDAKSIPYDQPTMNLGFMTDGTAGHEFGHAIGLAHEHQNPDGGIVWNEEAVIKDLSGPPNYWSKQEIRHNVLDKYKADQIRGTEFDPLSIMLYSFPATWTKNGIETTANEVLSTMDKRFVASAIMYPKSEAGIMGRVPLLTVGSSKWKQGTIRKGGEEDLYKFRVSTGGRYVMETKGKTDIVMKVFGPNSHTRLIAEDDDSGTGENARVILALVPGEYYVQVRHFNEEAGRGKYEIGVRKHAS